MCRRLILIGLVIGIAGCGRIRFDPSRSGTMDAGAPLDGGDDCGGVPDAPSGDAGGGCTACDPFDSIACSGSETCDVNPFWADADPGACREVGVAARGDECIAVGGFPNSCIAGHSCFDDYGCIRLCRSNTDCTTGGFCLLFIARGCVGLCTDDCIALADTGCEMGKTCNPLPGAGRGSLCRFANPAGTGGARCFKPSDCAAGHVCADDADTPDPTDGLCKRLWSCDGTPCSTMAVPWADDRDGTPLCVCL